MPRTKAEAPMEGTVDLATETCPACNGEGYYLHGSAGEVNCSICGGNGFVTVFPASDEPINDKAASLDFSVDPPPPPANRMVNATWRILEKQRVSALEVAEECDREIARWTKKRDDALRAANMCLAGQKGAE